MNKLFNSEHDNKIQKEEPKRKSFLIREKTTSQGKNLKMQQEVKNLLSFEPREKKPNRKSALISESNKTKPKTYEAQQEVIKAIINAKTNSVKNK